MEQKEHPILFSTPMILAILDGKKTQTRRVIKLHTKNALKYPAYIGDLLWVRETFAHVPASAYANSSGVKQNIDPKDPDCAAIYKAGWERSGPCHWTPSIHMPRWASRITLKITDIRQEFLQNISERDARAEGLNSRTRGGVRQYEIPGRISHDLLAWDTDPIQQFRKLWDFINCKRGYGWDTNPPVWVIKFALHSGG